MKNTPLKKSNKPIKRGNGKIKSRRVKTIEKKKQISKIRDEYFECHLQRCTSSEESGAIILEPTRANICHIFDKSRHTSLQGNLENCIYLTFSEHQDFDRYLYSHQFDKLEDNFKNSWGNTCILLNKLLSLCEENTVFTRAIEKYLNGRA